MQTIDPILTHSEFDTIIYALQQMQRSTPDVPAFISMQMLDEREIDGLIEYLRQCRGNVTTQAE